MTEKYKHIIKNSFSDIEFEPIAHTYNLGGKNLPPVSTVLKSFYPEFDTYNKAVNYAFKYNLTVEEVIQKWNNDKVTGQDLGHRVHDFAERYFYNHDILPSDGFEQAVINFWNSLPAHIVPLVAEARVYSQKYGFAGTSDNLFLNLNNNSVIISDYKTNKNIHKNYMGTRMLEPFSNLFDTPLNHYQVQLNLYQIPIEDVGISVSERWIIWLKGDGTYDLIECQNLTHELRNLLN